jgi:hypothetical protein
MKLRIKATIKKQANEDDKLDSWIESFFEENNYILTMHRQRRLYDRYEALVEEYGEDGALDRLEDDAKDMASTDSDEGDPWTEE